MADLNDFLNLDDSILNYLEIWFMEQCQDNELKNKFKTFKREINQFDEEFNNPISRARKTKSVLFYNPTDSTQNPTLIPLKY